MNSSVVQFMYSAIEMCCRNLLNLLCIVLCGLIFSCSSIKTKSQNETADILWHLSNYALQSRQLHGNRLQQSNLNPAIKYPYDPNRYMPLIYPIHQYATPYPYQLYPYQPYPHLVQGSNHQYAPHYLQANKQHNYPIRLDHPNPNRFSDFKPPSQSFMDILYSVASNDDLQCVPKIICEVTSDTMFGRQYGVNLPVAVNMQSLIGFLSGLNGLQTSPLFYFAKAAILGYSLKGNSRSCGSSFPDCPADPDKLIQYLNNHNGGFFRFFGGLHPSQNQQDLAQLYQGQQSHQNNFKKKQQAEKRIQNIPSSYIGGTSVEQQNGITFPPQEFYGFRSPKELSFPPSKDIFFLYKTRNPFRFPDVTKENNPYQSFRKPKALPYDISLYQTSELELQKPLPNHKANPMIFPDRTGTGELRLDLEDIDNRYQYAFVDDSQSQNHISNERELFSFPG